MYEDIETPYEYFMLNYAPPFDTEYTFKFPSRLIFKALRCSTTDIISFFNIADDKYRIKTNMNIEFEHKKSIMYLEYKKIHEEISYIPFFTEKMLFSDDVTISYLEWEKWTNAYCEEDKDHKGYYDVKYELLNINDGTINNSLLQDKIRLERLLSEAQNNYGLCSLVIKLRMEGKSQEEVAKQLKESYNFSDPTLGALIYDEGDGKTVTLDAFRKCARRALESIKHI